MKDFIPKYNHWYSCMMRYPSYYRYLLTVCVLGSFCIVWYLSVYRYVNSKISFYTNSTKAAQTQLIEQEKKHTSRSASSQSIKVIKQEIQACTESSLSPNDFIAFLIQELINSRILLVKSSIETPILKNSYIQYPIALDVQCPCNALLQFLKHVSLKSRSVGLSHINLSRRDSDIFTVSLQLNYSIMQR